MVTKRDRDVSIEVVSRHQHVSDRTRAAATEKAQKLTRFNDRIAKIQVLLEEGHGEFLAEVIAHVEKDATMVGKGEGSGFRAAMDTAFERLGRQLKKHKEIRRNHKHETADFGFGVGLDDESSFEEEVVRQALRD